MNLCPICRAESGRFFQSNGFWIRRCSACEHCFAEIVSDLGSVESVYDDDYFFGGGVGYPDYLSERELLIEHGRRYGRMLSKYMQPARVFDVGAAAGFLLEGLKESGWTPQGVEPHGPLADYAREQFRIDIIVGTLEDLQLETHFDLITMIQLVAHFRNPRRAFEVASSITRPGGYWLIETWNYRSLTARALGKHWHEWSPPSVLQWFSPQSLVELCRQHGLDVVIQGRPQKRLNGEHAKSLLRQAGNLAPRQVGLRRTGPYCA